MSHLSTHSLLSRNARTALVLCAISSVMLASCGSTPTPMAGMPTAGVNDVAVQNAKNPVKTFTTYTGTVNAGHISAQPASEGFTYSGGILKAVMTADEGTNFDLYLQKLSNGEWTDLAGSFGTTSSEEINGRTVSAGTYRWVVYAASGSGSFTLTQTATGTAPVPVPPASTTTKTYSGTLTTQTASVQPGAGFTYDGGTLKGTLTGDEGTNFDLYLQQLSNGEWTDLAGSFGTTSSEVISTTVAAGTYRWVLFSTSGSGSFTLTQTATGTAPVPATPPTPPVSTSTKTYTGTLAAQTASAQPDLEGFSHTGGMLKGTLTGDEGTNFDLYLQQLSNGEWTDVEGGYGPTSSEEINVMAAAGTYRWVLFSTSGSGSFTLNETR